jgi:hypothetical protein
MGQAEIMILQNTGNLHPPPTSHYGRLESSATSRSNLKSQTAANSKQIMLTLREAGTDTTNGKWLRGLVY